MFFHFKSSWKAGADSVAAWVTVVLLTVAPSILNSGPSLSNFLAAAAAAGEPNWLFILLVKIPVKLLPRPSGHHTQNSLLTAAPHLSPCVEFKTKPCL